MLSMLWWVFGLFWSHYLTYVMASLVEPWMILIFNPVLYLISGFRWGFYEVADISVYISLGMIALFLSFCTAVTWWMFKAGYRLKNWKVCSLKRSWHYAKLLEKDRSQEHCQAQCLDPLEHASGLGEDSRWRRRRSSGSHMLAFSRCCFGCLVRHVK